MTSPASGIRDTLAHPRFKATAVATDAPRARLDAIDILRGLVMIIMMLDHTRDFVNAENFRFGDPTDLRTTTVPIFFTRWITHFCAPIFVFLAGTSIYLQKVRGKTDLTSFLVKRGLWLVVLELTLLKVVIWFNVVGTFTWLLQVIWVIGIGMLLMAALVRFPTWVAGVVGFSMIALHNLTDAVRVPGWQGPTGPAVSLAAKLWILVHQGGPVPIGASDGPIVLVLYSLVPWIGIMAAGYAFGRIYELEWAQRRKLLVQIGAGCVLAFMVLRIANVYGDPSRWSSQETTAMTIVSFFNVTKYPASLLFVLMTIGPGLIALAAFEGWRAESRVKSFLMTFGRVPLFYYMLQWIWAHGMAVALAFATGKEVAYLFRGLPDMYTTAPPNAGFSLGITWLVWLAGVFALYPVCKWYAGVKSRRKDWWISYT